MVDEVPDSTPDDAAETADDVPPTQKKPSKTKQIIATIVTIVLLIIIFAGIGNALGGFDEAFKRVAEMSTADLFWLSLAALVNLMIYPLPYLASTPGLKYWPAFNVADSAICVGAVMLILSGWIQRPAKTGSSKGTCSITTRRATERTSRWNSSRKSATTFRSSRSMR